jgi:hypothetical protein
MKVKYVWGPLTHQAMKHHGLEPPSQDERTGEPDDYVVVGVRVGGLEPALVISCEVPRLWLKEHRP